MTTDFITDLIEKYQEQEEGVIIITPTENRQSITTHYVNLDGFSPCGIEALSSEGEEFEEALSLLFKECIGYGVQHIKEQDKEDE